MQGDGIFRSVSQIAIDYALIKHLWHMPFWHCRSNWSVNVAWNWNLDCLGILVGLVGWIASLNYQSTRYEIFQVTKAHNLQRPTAEIRSIFTYSDSGDRHSPRDRLPPPRRHFQRSVIKTSIIGVWSVLTIETSSSVSNRQTDLSTFRCFSQDPKNAIYCNLQLRGPKSF